MQKEVTNTVYRTVGFFAGSFLTVALLFTADYDGGADLLDAVIDYVRAATP